MSGYQNQQQRDALANKPKLVVRVIEARGIKAADFGGTSDPFVEVRIKGQTHFLKTKTIKKTLSPCWNEELVLYPSDPEKEILLIKCYDQDQTTNNDLLGEIELPVSVFVNRAPQEEWRQFQNRKGSTLKPGKGELKLSVSYVSQQQQQTQPLYSQGFPQQAVPQQAIPQQPYTVQSYSMPPPQTYAPPPQVYAAPIPQPTYYPPPQQPTYYPTPPQPQPTYYPPPQQPQPVYYPPPPQPQPTFYPPPQQNFQTYPPPQQYAPPPSQSYPPPPQQYTVPPQQGYPVPQPYPQYPPHQGF